MITAVFVYSHPSLQSGSYLTDERKFMIWCQGFIYLHLERSFVQETFIGTMPETDSREDLTCSQSQQYRFCGKPIINQEC
jgi:hypothetical protein